MEISAEACISSQSLGHFEQYMRSYYLVAGCRVFFSLVRTWSGLCISLSKLLPMVTCRPLWTFNKLLSGLWSMKVFYFSSVPMLLQLYFLQQWLGFEWSCRVWSASSLTLWTLGVLPPFNLSWQVRFLPRSIHLFPIFASPDLRQVHHVIARCGSLGSNRFHCQMLLQL